ncbi:A1S_2505 family phage non-structural protein [Wielerella bovis]|uniref:A1S_2505 family phage non-structural protein n=1 Tax=Wielerella bovis TaxID=2917790 RepID=UPI00201A21A6|nr:hypothetical protein [Wielerella bovis]MCG7656375.1 hypothetical protein [Wielerella bovis]MCG7658600.1 hypothetical protein [Wielerella bovis]ULJ60710.1 hypothetical protein MIS44_02220 [Wielerella bovis]ULJ69708.1 hypothetical protein MIS45_02290 [Wielerella bovis]
MTHQIQAGEIFVFGSNTTGRHGKGAALTAKLHFGAKQGQGVGLEGQSYAIPTKNGRLQTLPLSKIEQYVNDFIQFANQHHELKFFVTAIGTGLAGYKHEQIAPMFANAPANCRLPPEWIEILS